MQNNLPYQDDKRTNLHRKQVCESGKTKCARFEKRNVQK